MKKGFMLVVAVAIFIPKLTYGSSMHNDFSSCNEMVSAGTLFFQKKRGNTVGVFFLKDAEWIMKDRDAVVTSGNGGAGGGTTGGGAGGSK